MSLTQPVAIHKYNLEFVSTKKPPDHSAPLCQMLEVYKNQTPKDYRTTWRKRTEFIKETA